MGESFSQWLVATLRNGAVNSRVIHAVAAERGYTTNQLRYARECLGLTVSRRGNRRSMHSVWALPAVDVTDSNVDVAAPRVPLNHLAAADADHSAHALTRAYSSAPTSDDTQAQFTEGEQRRIERRAAYFQSKGMGEGEAVGLAQHLVLERDRVPEMGYSGSCWQCENLRSDGSCVATAEVGVMPRPAREVWYCVFARRPIG